MFSVCFCIFLKVNTHFYSICWCSLFFHLIWPEKIDCRNWTTILHIASCVFLCNTLWIIFLTNYHHRYEFGWLLCSALWIKLRKLFRGANDCIFVEITIFLSCVASMCFLVAILSVFVSCWSKLSIKIHLRECSQELSQEFIVRRLQAAERSALRLASGNGFANSIMIHLHGKSIWILNEWKNRMHEGV